MNIDRLNNYSWERVKQYQSLNIYGVNVNTPYFTNDIQSYFVDLMRRAGIEDEKIGMVTELYKQRAIPYGWYRGKGTPEEITVSTKYLSAEIGLSLSGSTSDEIREIMKYCGVGIDCSGFVFNVLSYAFEKDDCVNTFLDILDWSNANKRGVNYAGAFVFAGAASFGIHPREVKPLDLILIKGRDRKRYVHIAMVLEDIFEDKLKIVQSTLSSHLTGVKVDDLTIGDRVFFGHKPEVGSTWENLLKDGQLEFKRLNCLE